MRRQHQQLFGSISRSEEGVALVLSIMVMMVVGALAGVAAASALEATDQSTQDRRVKQAISAADAGMDVSLYRLNKFASLLTDTVQCVVPDPATGILHGAVVLPDGWCPTQTEEMGSGASFSYRVSAPLRVDNAGQDVWQRKVVATGTVAGVKRRAAMVVNAPTGQSLFSDAVFSQEDLLLRNLARINGSARSNGNVITQNSSIICGNVTPGPGKQFQGGSQCGGFTSHPATEPFVLSPVVLPLYQRQRSHRRPRPVDERGRHRLEREQPGAHDEQLLHAHPHGRQLRVLPPAALEQRPADRARRRHARAHLHRLT